MPQWGFNLNIIRDLTEVQMLQNFPASHTTWITSGTALFGVT